jgi:hypothetical protein
LEPAAVACHDIVVHVAKRLAAGACAEQGQVCNIGTNGLPDTAHPVSIADDLFHSAMFNNEATVETHKT